MQFYVNGSLLENDKYEGGILEISGGSDFIGKSNWSNDAYFQGYMSEFRIWNRVLTKNEIFTRKDRLLNGDEASLLAYWQFNAIEGSFVNSSGSVGNMATLMGNARIVSVPAIAPLLIPGELEKVAQKHYDRAITAVESENYLKAVSEFEKALEYVNNFKDALQKKVDAQRLANEKVALENYNKGLEYLGRYEYRKAYEAFVTTESFIKNFKDVNQKRQDVLGKAQYKVAVVPFKSRVYGFNVNDFNNSFSSRLYNRNSTFIKWTNLSSFASRNSTGGRNSNLNELTNQAKDSDVRILVTGEIVDMSSNVVPPEREMKTADYVREVTYTDDKGKKKTRKEKTGSETYYIIKKSKTLSCKVLIQIIDTLTEEVLKVEEVSTLVKDELEYAETRADIDYLWVWDSGLFGWGKGYKPLSQNESRFRASKNFRSDSELLVEASGVLLGKSVETAFSFLEPFAPVAYETTSFYKEEQKKKGEKLTQSKDLYERGLFHEALETLSSIGENFQITEVIRLKRQIGEGIEKQKKKEAAYRQQFSVWLPNSSWVKFDSWGKQEITFLDKKNLKIVNDQSRLQGAPAKSVFEGSYQMVGTGKEVIVRGQIESGHTEILMRWKPSYTFNDSPIHLIIMPASKDRIAIETGDNMLLHITNDKNDNIWRRK